MEKGQYGKAEVNGLMCVGLALSSKLRMLAYLHMQGAWWNGNLVMYVSLFSFLLLSTFFFEIGFCKYLLYNRTHGGGGGGSGRHPAGPHYPTILLKAKASTWIPWALQG